MTELDSPTPLAGFTIGITAARRSEELATLLQRRGANIVTAPAIRIIPLSDDTELERVTRQLVAEPPQIAVATTGIGFRGWMEAAEGWGLAEELRETLSATRMLARGPKAKGAIRAAELREEWSPASESSAEVLDHLLAQGVEGVRIAVQLHGATTEWEPVPDFCEVLRMAGADVVPVPVYRWIPPEDRTPMDRLIEAIVTSGLDCVTFTSAPAVASLLMRAKETGLLEAVLHALRGRVLAACVGPITAAPLEELGVPTSMPGRARLGALARHVAEELPRRANRIQAGGHNLSVRGGCVVVDGQVRQLAPAPMALMRALARQPGRVVSREDLLAALPGGGEDTHAVETAIARLRAGLGTPKAIQTVVKRGYRLALDPTESYDNPRPATSAPRQPYPGRGTNPGARPVFPPRAPGPDQSSASASFRQAHSVTAHTEFPAAPAPVRPVRVADSAVAPASSGSVRPAVPQARPVDAQAAGRPVPAADSPVAPASSRSARAANTRTAQAVRAVDAAATSASSDSARPADTQARSVDPSAASRALRPAGRPTVPAQGNPPVTGSGVPVRPTRPAPSLGAW
ncbi:bifunctional uroporphyrinogen-III synthetase/response regulator domain protein [Nocardia otitidiscaviarum]|uniref:Bifunctional uroporphyrinogen-III synthetase/response regulator domain protein n=2 Tax=Nocardia otitidiscaviarum TaxID=1823 RepID=A0A378Y8V1_9NOCA|nr:bifunctional uroporphyrinogen-III synthetase/response regulator domain protein [Nocardia otitidiscaviarum]